MAKTIMVGTLGFTFYDMMPVATYKEKGITQKLYQFKWDGMMEIDIGLLYPFSEGELLIYVHDDRLHSLWEATKQDLERGGQFEALGCAWRRNLH